MSAELREDQKLRRVIKVYGIEGGVIVTLTHSGISFKVPRTKLGVEMTWPEAVKACRVSDNLPAKFEGRPMEFLIDQTVKAAKRAIKKESK